MPEASLCEKSHFGNFVKLDHSLDSVDNSLLSPDYSLGFGKVPELDTVL